MKRETAGPDWAGPGMDFRTMAKLDVDLGCDEEDRWEGLARLFDDVVQDCWGDGDEDPSSLEVDEIDPATGVYSEAPFSQLLKEAIRAAQHIRAARSNAPKGTVVIALLAVRLKDWDRLGSFLGAGGREEVCAWVARRLEELLRLEDDLGRTRPDTFVLLLRGIAPDELGDLVVRCTEMVESNLCEVYAESVQVRVACGTVSWEGERADRLLESAWRAAGSE